MNLGDILFKLWESVYGLVPFGVVHVWQQGVRIRGGNIVKLLRNDNGLFKTGIHFFVPILEEIHVEDTSIAVVASPAQTLLTADGKTVTTSFIATYYISNYQKMLETIYDQEEIVVMEIQAAAGSLLSAMSYTQARHELGDTIYEMLHTKLSKWGINLEEVVAKSFAKCDVHRLIGGQS